jgi:hypothetical protein
VKRCKDKKSDTIYAVKMMRNLDEERVLAARNEFSLL